MSFNWFNRQNEEGTNNASANPEAMEKEIPNANEDDSASEDCYRTSSTSEISKDLLAFAKAAYHNIQEKKEAQTTTDVGNKLSSPTEKLKGEFTDVNGLTELVDNLTTAVTTTTTDIPSGSSINETSLTIQEKLESTPTNLSFIERATAERYLKQERLTASPIELEDIEKAQTTANNSIEEITLIEFDDGFIWSAEVLEAQGKRADDISIEEITWLKRLRQGLDRTRRNIVNQLKAIVGQGPLNQVAVDEIEAALLQADVGVEVTDYIINSLQQKLKEKALPLDEAITYLKKILRDILDNPLKDSGRFSLERGTLNIWLMTGVNGAGKTTTIGKLAHLAQKSGYNCLIGAADTFRAAAVEQVKIWGERSGVEVVANPSKNVDPASVVFDAITAAKSRNIELLLVDTAGRLQNKKNLMDELSKIRRTISKKAPDAKVESLLVLDATLGQNGLRQAEVFSQAAKLSGVVLTKLDGTARGGVALAVVQRLGLPIRFIGAGEGIDDLRPFCSYEFVEALLGG